MRSGRVVRGVLVIVALDFAQLAMFSTREASDEIITPYKITLVTIITKYADIADGRYPKNDRVFSLDEEHSSKKKMFNSSLLTWIYQPDGALKNILQTIAVFSKDLNLAVTVCLQELCDSESPQALDDFFENLSALITDPPSSNLLQRGGVLGVFCRWIVLSYENLEFSEFRSMHEELRKYCCSILDTKTPSRSVRIAGDAEDPGDSDTLPDESKSDSIDEMELESQSELDSKSSDESNLLSELKRSDLKTDSKSKSETLHMPDVYTFRQADFFFTQQATLITDKESYAMPPDKLQAKISQILKNNQNLTEAHYLSYLNCLRVREFCGAIDCLLTFFSKHTKTGASPDETGKICRYAALNLALLHHKFGHKNAALAAAREAVDLSQLASDTECLQHAISLLSELDPTNVKLSLIEHQVKPAKKMSLTSLAAKAIMKDSNKQALLGMRPRSIFTRLAASEALARSKAVESLNLTSYIHKGALWNLYGKTHMASLFCQLALSTYSTSYKGYHFYPWQPNSSDVALSLCHLTEILHESGEISAAQDVIQHLKHRFPWNTEHSKLWRMTELRLKHLMALRNCKFNEARQVEKEIMAMDKQEAKLRIAERLYYCGESVAAHDTLQEILKTSGADNDASWHGGTDNKHCTAEMKCQIYIYLGRLLFNELSGSSYSSYYLLKALSISEKFRLHKLSVKAKLLISQLQLYSHFFNTAKKTLKSCTRECLTHGTLMERSCLKMIEAKCYLLSNSSPTVADVDTAIDRIQEASQGFEVLQDLHRRKDAVYFLARLHHQKSVLLSKESSVDQVAVNEATALRNGFSSEFKQIDCISFSAAPLLLI